MSQTEWLFRGVLKTFIILICDKCGSQVNVSDKMVVQGRFKNIYNPYLWQMRFTSECLSQTECLFRGVLKTFIILICDKCASLVSQTECLFRGVLKTFIIPICDKCASLVNVPDRMVVQGRFKNIYNPYLWQMRFSSECLRQNGCSGAF